MADVEDQDEGAKFVGNLLKLGLGDTPLIDDDMVRKLMMESMGVQVKDLNTQVLRDRIMRGVQFAMEGGMTPDVVAIFGIQVTVKNTVDLIKYCIENPANTFRLHRWAERVDALLFKCTDEASV